MTEQATTDLVEGLKTWASVVREAEKQWSEPLSAMLEQAAATITAQQAEIERLRELLANPPKHKFWGAGEPECPREIKCGNGELHTLRCKLCGQDNPRDQICRGSL